MHGMLKAFLVSIIAGFVLGFMFTFPDFNVKHIRPSEGVVYSDSNLAEKVSRQYMDRNIFFVLIKSFFDNSALEKQTEVLKVTTSIKLPDTVVTRFVERKPHLLIRDDKNDVLLKLPEEIKARITKEKNYLFINSNAGEYIVDSNGFVFHKMSSGDAKPDVPVLLVGTGVEVGSTINQESADEAIEQYQQYVQLKIDSEIKELKDKEKNRKSKNTDDEAKLLQKIKAVEKENKDNLLFCEHQIYNVLLLYEVAHYAVSKKLDFSTITMNEYSAITMCMPDNGPEVDFGALSATQDKVDLLSDIYKFNPAINSSAKEICLLSRYKATYKPKKKR